MYFAARLIITVMEMTMAVILNKRLYDRSVKYITIKDYSDNINKIIRMEI